MLVSLGSSFQNSPAAVSDVTTLPGSCPAAVAKLLELDSQAFQAIIILTEWV